MWQLYLAVMVAGALGSGARMGLSTLVDQQHGSPFPFGTVAVNILGCLIIGLFDGLTRPHGGFAISPIARQAVMIGFLGGFTTFSSFSLQTLTLMTDGKWIHAILNVVTSVVFCLLAAWAGQSLASHFTKAPTL